jgi:hypothetical protein
MARAQHGEPEVAPSRSLSACQSVDVGGGHRLATDPPVAAFDLFDEAKGTWRMFSPSTETIASVSLLMIWRFCSLVNTSLMT